MTSPTSIANVALARIGQPPIVSLNDDDNDRARQARILYDAARRAILDDHPWNFATVRAELSQLSDAPLFGYEFAYQLPSDFLGLMRMGSEDVYINNPDYRIETQEVSGVKRLVLLTNEDIAQIVYVADITDVQLMSHSFREALAFRLAADMAESLHPSDSLAQRMRILYNDAMNNARFRDSTQHRGTRERLTSSVLLTARRTGEWLPRLEVPPPP